MFITRVKPIYLTIKNNNSTLMIASTASLLSESRDWISSIFMTEKIIRQRGSQGLSGGHSACASVGAFTNRDKQYRWSVAKVGVVG